MPESHICSIQPFDHWETLSRTKHHTSAKSICLIVPVYNEQNSIDSFIETIDKVLDPWRSTYRFEVLFVNDGSFDQTEHRITQYARQRSDVKLINLSRNFGKEAALSAGITHAPGDAVIPMDVDLQDPPELIPKMILEWENGAKIVNARRVLRKSDTWIKRGSAKAFYLLYNALAEQPIPDNVGDFRLMDREVVNIICRFGERSRMNKAIFSWVGFETVEIPYERCAREVGETAWSYWKLWRLALDGIFASSTMPLRVWTYAGVGLFLTSIIYIAYILLHVVAKGVDVPGYASIILVVLLFGGMNMLALGIIGQYVGRIYTEVRQRPLFVVRSFVSRNEEAS